MKTWHYIKKDELIFPNKDIRNGMYMVYTLECYCRIFCQHQMTDEKSYLMDAHAYRMVSKSGYYVYIPVSELLMKLENHTFEKMQEEGLI